MIALVLLLAGLWAGLLRLAWALPLLSQALPISHGPLLISGFFGTLICLERAVAIGRRWAYVAPLLAGLGGLSVLISGNAGIGPWLLLAGSLWLLAIFYVILRRHAVLFTWFLTLGALCWVAGNALWLSGRSIAQVLAWWICFLVLTIAAERLELGRLLRLSARRKAWFVLAGGACVLGSILTLVDVTIGVRILGVGLFALAVDSREGLKPYSKNRTIIVLGWRCYERSMV